MEKFTLKNIGFLALMSALQLLLNAPIVPLVMLSPIFGIQNMATALLTGMIMVIGLIKVKKVGSIFIMGILSGSILLFMSPIMFLNNVIAGFVAEIIAYIIYRGYTKKKAMLLAASLYIPLTLPVSFMYKMVIKDMSAAEVWGSTPRSVLICLATIILSVIGALIGLKIGKELKRAGKLT